VRATAKPTGTPKLLHGSRPQAEQLYDELRRGNAKLIGPDGKPRPLPNSLHSFVIQLTSILNERKPVCIVQDQATLTTIEAAATLGVSRQFLVNILEQGKIPYHLVGSHRRIYAKDLFVYKAERDTNRRKILRELSKQEAAEGLYGRIPPVDES
jgi:excisionase family DNA binding protein